MPVNSHRNTGAIATGSSGRAPTPYDVAASSVQHCSSQAMFSGAISSAPRWSVVGLTGNATAWWRGSSSRPPPEEAAETREITRTLM